MSIIRNAGDVMNRPNKRAPTRRSVLLGEQGLAAVAVMQNEMICLLLL